MAEIVGAELQFKTVDGCLAGWRRHHTGIVDENIYMIAFTL